jgi:hypothetical protein
MSKETILIVDNKTSIIEVVCVYLKKVGFRVSSPLDYFQVQKK